MVRSETLSFNVENPYLASIVLTPDRPVAVRGEVVGFKAEAFDQYGEIYRPLGHHALEIWINDNVDTAKFIDPTTGYAVFVVVFDLPGVYLLDSRGYNPFEPHTVKSNIVSMLIV